MYSCIATLKYGLDILFEQEQVTVDNLLGHGGLFKVPVVGQKLLAGALGVPVSVMKTAGEGGPWGMALLAGYRLNRNKDENLENYLQNHIPCMYQVSCVRTMVHSLGERMLLRQYTMPLY